jgi:putative intracellular protease/amidase
MPVKRSESICLLLLWGDLYGANCAMTGGGGGRKLTIVERFRRYGWELTSAGATARVSPCAFAAGRGAEPIELERAIDSIDSIEAYDGISVMPGPSHKGLIESPHALALVKAAFEGGLVVSAWCRGVRVLAAADVIRGKRIVCHADDREAVEAADGIFVGHDHPPEIDGPIVTGARSYYYRVQNADAIRDAMNARLASMTAKA